MTEIDYKKIGLKIKKYRKKLNLTQVELGNMVRKTESSIWKYEKGIIKIPTDVLEELSNIFNISVFNLISTNKIKFNYIKNIDIKDTDIKINAEDYEEYIKFKEISEIVLNMKKLSENKKLEIERYLKKAYLLSKNYNLEE